MSNEQTSVGGAGWQTTSSKIEGEGELLRVPSPSLQHVDKGAEPYVYVSCRRVDDGRLILLRRDGLHLHPSLPSSHTPLDPFQDLCFLFEVSKLNLHPDIPTRPRPALKPEA